MREIKFRYTGVRKNGHVFHQVFNLAEIEMGKAKQWITVNNVGMHELHIREFAGLLDKNGVEIYEGDIGKRNGYPDFIYEVCWHEDTAMYLLWNHYAYINDWSGAVCPPHTFEVIGNIYENPELLKVKDDKS